jgi:hypothetical protein
MQSVRSTHQLVKKLQAFQKPLDLSLARVCALLELGYFFLYPRLELAGAQDEHFNTFIAVRCRCCESRPI